MQHSYSIQNQAGAAFRADLNDALTAIVSNNSGATEPNPSHAFQWWADTTSGILKQRNAANNEWIEILTLATGRPLNAVPQTASDGVAILPACKVADLVIADLPASGLLVTQDTDSGFPMWFDRAAAQWKRLDPAKVATDLDSANDKIQALEDSLGFTIIYPNGGTEAAPATVTVNSRYVSANPFPGKQVLCVAETLRNGVWSETGWIWSTGGQGVKASQYGDSIVVQTGDYSLGNTPQTTGSAHPLGPSGPEPVRVKVWKVGV